jgi:hypothetical protein
MTYNVEMRAKAKPLRYVGLMIFFLFSLHSWAGPSGTYQEQRLTMVKRLADKLTKLRYCENENDCIKKTLLLVGRSSKGIYIETYEIEDPNAIQEILVLCVEMYKENQKKMTISLVMYHQSHDKIMGVLSQLFKNPFASLLLEGE